MRANLTLLFKCLLRDLTRKSRPIKDLDTHLGAAVDWLCHAQDVTLDGGVALRYSMIKGWQNSYPETTGYIIPTFFAYADLMKSASCKARALRMAEWELSIQRSDGSFLGGPIGSGLGSFVFDTGQIIFGLLETYERTGETKFLNAAVKAGEWLVDCQDVDGKWSRYTYFRIPHTYYTRVAWALAKLGRVTSDYRFVKAACKNIEWSLTMQQENGWIAQCGFGSQYHNNPYTHTIAYAIRGILETGLTLGIEEYIQRARYSADRLSLILKRDGIFRGTYDPNWLYPDSYTCLTGDAQIALIYLRLYQLTKLNEYLRNARVITHFLCTHQEMDSNPDAHGAIPGSFPIWGRYQRFAFPNWAAKFFIDALLLEKKLVKPEEVTSEDSDSLEK